MKLKSIFGRKTILGKIKTIFDRLAGIFDNLILDQAQCMYVPGTKTVILDVITQHNVIHQDVPFCTPIIYINSTNTQYLYKILHVAYARSPLEQRQIA